MTNSLSRHKLGSDHSLYAFLFSVHDWLAYIVGEPYWWNDHDATIKQVILEKVATLKGNVPLWVDVTVSAQYSIHTLLNQHYLCQAALEEEIYPDRESPLLYAIMAVTMVIPSVFTPLPSPDLWQGIDGDPHPINVLRSRRVRIRTYVHQLALREDETEHRLVRDHGLLSSMALLYGLYLVRIILIYEVTVRPDKNLSVILTSLSDTITQAKGVLYHDQSNWLGLDVQ